MQPAVTRRAKVRGAEQVLNALLRTPKTREGLIAVVASWSISRNFVFGWLTNQIRTGLVTAHKSSAPPTFQLTVHCYTETPGDGAYPAWLEPRGLPDANPGRVYIDGKSVQNNERKEA